MDIALNKRIFMLFSTGESSYKTVTPIGTAFGIAKPGLLLTSDHVVNDRKVDSLIVTCTFFEQAKNYKIDKIESNQEADIAALFIHPVDSSKLEWFEIGYPSAVSPKYKEFPLAEDVLAYGFPMVGNEKPIHPRMMKGHIQAKYSHKGIKGGRYAAYELSFPAFPNLSGSPVFRDWNKRNEAIGIVTERISYHTEQGDHETKAYMTIAAALHPVADWIMSL